MLDMLALRGGNRDKWEFEYTASTLATGASAQKTFRQSRVDWWTEQKEKLMTEVRESGLEISESVGAGYSNATRGNGPQVMVRNDLQTKLSECHDKIQEHTDAVTSYDGWIQVLQANPESRLKLTQADWLYFFGKA